MGEILIPRRTKVEKGYELLADITVGTATTSVDITGLNIGKGDEVMLVSYHVAVSGDNSINLYVNSNTTATNYWTQWIRGQFTTVSASRNNSSIIDTPSSMFGADISIVKLKLTNSGYFVAQSDNSRYLNSNIRIYNMYVTSTFTMASITSLNLVGSVSNNIGIGSRFQLYKIN